MFEIMIPSTIGTLCLPLILWIVGILAMTLYREKLPLNKLEFIGISWFIGISISGYMLFSLYLLKINMDPPICIITLILMLGVLNLWLHRKAIFLWNINNIHAYVTKLFYSFSNKETMISITIILIPLCSILMVNLVKPVWGYDSFLIWSLKAKLIYHYGITHLWTANNAYTHTHLTYPLLIPICVSLLNKFQGFFSEFLGNSILTYTVIATACLTVGFSKKYIPLLFSGIITAMLIGNSYLMLLSISGYMDMVIAYSFLAYCIVLYYIVWEKHFNLLPIFACLAICLQGIKAEGTALFCLSICLSLFFWKKEFIVKLIPFVITVLLASVFNIIWMVYVNHLGLKNNVFTEGFSQENILLYIQDLPTIINYLITITFSLEKLFPLLMIGIIGLSMLYKKNLKSIATYFLLLYLSISGLYILILAIFPININIILATSCDRIFSHLAGVLLIPLILGLSQETQQKTEMPTTLIHK